MTRALSAGLLVALLSAMPAAADHCPPGQFFRVRLNQCVGLNTRLASTYVHAEASRLATPGSGDEAALPVEPEANPVGEPKIVTPFVCRRSTTGRRQNSHEAARPPSRKWPECANSGHCATVCRTSRTDLDRLSVDRRSGLPLARSHSNMTGGFDGFLC
jgi:hypothetical protein